MYRYIYIYYIYIYIYIYICIYIFIYIYKQAGCLKVFVLHYHDSLEDSKKQNPKKMVFVDPSVAVVRVPALDTAGRVCFRMIEVY